LKTRPLLELAGLIHDAQHYELPPRETASLALTVITSLEGYLQAHPGTLVFENAVKTNLEQIRFNLTHEIRTHPP